LFPQHLAVEASTKKLAQKDEQEQTAKRRSKKEEAQEKALAAKLDGVEVVIAAKAEKGTLYAAVGPKQVKEALKEQGFKVDEDVIEMDPTKEIGSHEITLSFPSGFEALIHVIIEAK
jgi:large subunit ribosomal protein L9